VTDFAGRGDATFIDTTVDATIDVRVATTTVTHTVAPQCFVAAPCRNAEQRVAAVVADIADWGLAARFSAVAQFTIAVFGAATAVTDKVAIGCGLAAPVVRRAVAGGCTIVAGSALTRAAAGLDAGGIGVAIFVIEHAATTVADVVVPRGLATAPTFRRRALVAAGGAAVAELTAVHVAARLTARGAAAIEVGRTATAVTAIVVTVEACETAPACGQVAIVITATRPWVGDRQIAIARVAVGVRTAAARVRISSAVWGV